MQSSVPTDDHDAEGLLLILCGPSGVGKTTIARRLLEARPRTTFSVSYTTRQPREGEVDGKAYHFVDEETFVAMREAGEFAESARVHGNFYGTTIGSIREAWAAGRDPIFDIDYQGARQLQQTFPHAVSVLIIPPDMTELERRLRNRGTDSDEVIERRLENARMELSQWRLFEYIVENDDLDETFEAVKGIYDSSRYSRHLRAAQLKKMLGQ